MQVPPWPLLQFFPPGSCLDLLPWLPLVDGLLLGSCKAFPSWSWLGHCFITVTEKKTRMGYLWVCFLLSITSLNLSYLRCLCVTLYSYSHWFSVLHSFLGYKCITSHIFHLNMKLLCFYSWEYETMSTLIFPIGLWMNTLYIILRCNTAGPEKQMVDCWSDSLRFSKWL